MVNISLEALQLALEQKSFSDKEYYYFNFGMASYDISTDPETGDESELSEAVIAGIREVDGQGKNPNSFDEGLMSYLMWAKMGNSINERAIFEAVEGNKSLLREIVKEVTKLSTYEVANLTKMCELIQKGDVLINCYNSWQKNDLENMLGYKDAFSFVYDSYKRTITGEEYKQLMKEFTSPEQEELKKVITKALVDIHAVRSKLYKLLMSKTISEKEYNAADHSQDRTYRGRSWSEIYDDPKRKQLGWKKYKEQVLK